MTHTVLEFCRRNRMLLETSGRNRLIFCVWNQDDSYETIMEGILTCWIALSVRFRRNVYRNSFIWSILMNAKTNSTFENDETVEGWFGYLFFFEIIRFLTSFCAVCVRIRFAISIWRDISGGYPKRFACNVCTKNEYVSMWFDRLWESWNVDLSFGPNGLASALQKGYQVSWFRQQGYGKIISIVRSLWHQRNQIFMSCEFCEWFVIHKCRSAFNAMINRIAFYWIYRWNLGHAVSVGGCEANRNHQ